MAIEENDAFQVFQSIDTLPEDVRPRAASMLSDYRKQQETAGLPLWPGMEKAKQDRRQRMQAAFDNPLELDKEDGSFIQADRVQPGLGDTLRKREASILWLADKYQVDENEVRGRLDFYKADASEKWGSGLLDDSAFFAKAKGEVEAKKSKVAALNTAAEAATASALNGGNDLADFAAWQLENEHLPEAFGEARKVWSATRKTILDKLGPDGMAAAKRGVRALQESTGVSEEADAWMNKARRDLVEIKAQDPKKYKLVLAAMQILGASSPKDDKGLMQGVGEKFGRSVETIAAGAVEATQIGSSRLADMGLTNAQDPEALAASIRAGIDVDADLRDLAAGVIDPVKSTREGILRDVEEGVYNIAGSAPYMLAVTIPGGQTAIAGSFTSDAYRDFRRAGWNGADAEAAAVASGVFQGAVEKASEMILKVPGVAGVFAKFGVKPGSNWATQFLLRSGVRAGVEVGEEVIQEATSPFIQELAAAVSSSVPDRPEGQKLRDVMAKFFERENFAPLLISVLPLGMIGAGLSTSRDMDVMSDAVRFFGEQEAAKIMAESDPAKRDLLIRERFMAMSPEELAKAARAGMNEEVAKSTEAAQALEQSSSKGIFPRIRADVNGWAVEDLDTGSMVRVGSRAEAIELAYSGMSDKERQSAESMAQMADEFLGDRSRPEAFEITKNEQRLEDEVKAGRVTQEQVREAAQLYGQLHGLTAEESKIELLEVLGNNIAEENEGVREYVSRIHGGGNLITVIHEGVHGRWNAGLKNGHYTHDQGLMWVRMAEQASGVQFLPVSDDAAVSSAMLDEAITEIVSADVIGRRKDVKQHFSPGLISRGISAFALSQRAEAKQAGKLAVFLKSWKGFWGKVLRNAKALQKARKEGKIGEDFDAFLDDLLGAEPQVRYEAQAAREAADMASTVDNAPFSLRGISESEAKTPMTIYRAGDADEKGIKPWASFTPEKETAEAYLDNPGFGGSSLRAETVAGVNDIYEMGRPSVKEFRKLAERIGLDSDVGQDWFDNGWQYPWEESSKVKRLIEDSGIDAIQYTDDFPAGATTIVFTREPELISDPNTPFSLRAVPTSEIQTIPEDLERAKADAERAGPGWAASVDLSEPVGVYRDKEGNLKLFDGHHRWLAADMLGEPLQVRESVFGRAVPIGEAPFVAEMPDGAQLVGPASFSIKAYHGTPHKVDKFKLANIGTGEGAQAYGWGLYFAEAYEVAKGYQDALGSRNAKPVSQEALFDGKTIAEVLPNTPGPVRKLIVGSIVKHGTINSAITEMAKRETALSKMATDAARSLMGANVTLPPQPGNLYTVELLPDEDEFLDWDKPMSEQSEKVKAKLWPILRPEIEAQYNQSFLEIPTWYKGNNAYADMSRIVETRRTVDISSAGLAYRGSDSSNKPAQLASKNIAALGIPGIRYLDGNSRDGGEGTRNYVIFDESLVKILEENGKPVESAPFSLGPRSLAAVADTVLASKMRSPEFREGFYTEARRRLAKLHSMVSMQKAAPAMSRVAEIQAEIEAGRADYEAELTQLRQDRDFEIAGAKQDKAGKLAQEKIKREFDQKITQRQKDWLREKATLEAKLGADDVRQSEANAKDAKERQMMALRTLDAILSAFPPEVRGRVGGFVKLAGLNTDKAREAEIERRLNKLDEVVESEAKKYYAAKIEKLFKRYKSQKDKSGRISGKLISTATEQVDYAAYIAGLDVEKQANETAALEKTIQDSDESGAVQDALNRLGILRLFEVMDLKDSESLESSSQWLETTIEEGKAGKRVLDEARKEFLDDMRAQAQAQVLEGEALNIDSANNLSNMNRAPMRSMVQKLRGMMSEALWTTLQRLEIIFGEGSAVTEYFAARVVGAANKSNDIKRSVSDQQRETLTAIFGSGDKFTHARGIAKLQKPRFSGVMIRRVTTKDIVLDIDTLTKLSDGKMQLDSAATSEQSFEFKVDGVTYKSGEFRVKATSGDSATLTKEQAQEALDEWAASDRKRSVTVTQTVNAGEPTNRYMSELQGIQWRLWWNQADSKKQMERDGWTEESITQLDAFLSSEAKALGTWISSSYQDAARMIDPIYRRLFNAPLPRVKGYAPIYRMTLSTDADMMDLSNSDMNSGLAAGFTKSRVNTTAPLLEIDALAAFLSHWENVSHWVSHAELMRDMKAVLIDRNVSTAIRQKKGDGVLSRLKEDIKTIESNGTSSAKELTNLSRAWRWLMQYRAYKGLAFRLSPIVKQTPALLNPLLADVPAHNYAAGLSRAFTSPQEFAAEVSAMWNSDIIRRRIEGGFSTEARIAQQGASMSGSQAIVLMQAGMMPMAYVDAGWTAMGSAVAFNYYRRSYLEQNPGATPEMADAYATARLERMIATSAQPSDIVNRSLYERSTNPFMRSMTMFVSDQRKALAIEVLALRKLATGKSKNKALDVQRVLVAHFIQAAVSQVIAAGLASMFGDDDDKEREWSIEQWGLALTLGPVNGLFVLGRLTDKIARVLINSDLYQERFGTGQRLPIFPNNDLAEKAADDLMRGTKSMDDLFNPDDPEDVMTSMDALSTAAASVGSTFFGPAAAVVDVSANIVREVAKMISED